MLPQTGWELTLKLLEQPTKICVTHMQLGIYFSNSKWDT